MAGGSGGRIGPKEQSVYNSYAEMNKAGLETMGKYYEMVGKMYEAFSPWKGIDAFNFKVGGDLSLFSSGSGNEAGSHSQVASGNTATASASAAVGGSANSGNR
jgi:hypothetical protein